MANLSGVITAIPTPLLPNEDLDADGLRRVLDYVLERGVNGVFVLGTMGEGPALLDSQKRLAVTTAAKHLAGRVPLLAGISDVSTRRTLEMGRQLQDLGADYLVTTPPYYYKFPHPESILEFVGCLASGLARPIVFYNAPWATGNPVDFPTIDKLLNIPNVAGIKDSSGNVQACMELLRKYPEKKTRPARIFHGDEFVFDVSLMMGADGLVTGGGTVFVDLLVKLYKAAETGDRATLFTLQQEFSRVMREMIGPELPIDWMYAIKKQLKARGLCDDHVTSPFLKRRR
jgi:4-hydroxy-tetrahydrodipicolinate synthase